jgi:ATP-binding cassette subfamily B protein
LAAGESVVAYLAVDLNSALQFREGVVVLTNRRLIAKRGGEPWQEWDLRGGLALGHRDHVGVGVLELCDGESLLARWNHTLDADLAVRRLTDQFQELVLSIEEKREARPPQATACPICEKPIPGGAEKCPACAESVHAPPSMRSLFRLGRFARPYRRSLVIGFVLTLLATGASLVPPYLVMPLTDEVLIPFNNGVPIDPHKVAFLLGGLLGAAVLAWVLDWAKTYILA